MAAETAKPAAVPAIVKPPLVSGGAVRAIVPSDIEAVYRLATIVIKAGMTPKAIDTAEKATVIIMHGMEVGFTPMAALQSIGLINGVPAVYGDGLIGLVQASGLLEDIIETIERDKDGSPLYAVCRVKRIGRQNWTEQSFSRAEAQKAGLWSKSGPWTQYPRRMLQMRARSWALRDAFPDVLKGLHSADEAQDMVDVTGSGSHTVTTPEPRRSDYMEASTAEDVTHQQATETHDEVRQDDETQHGWDLYDHTGETIGEYGITEWLGTFDAQCPPPKFKRERALYFQNNHPSAQSIYRDDDTPDALRKELTERWPGLAPTGDLLAGAK